MQFLQQFTIYESPAGGQFNGATPGNTSYGFGNDGKTTISLQVSFYNGTTLTAPSSGSVYITGSNDGNFGATPTQTWTLSPQANSDFVDVFPGPVRYLQVGWGQISWGSATSALITVSAERTNN